jgi:uncharacterized membrane protein YdbT with pleckstrin-like domain
MSYVQRALQPGEVVRYLGSLHWYTYLPGLLCMLAAIAALAWAEWGDEVSIFNVPILWQIIAAFLAIVASFLLIPEWFTWWTTEIAVTNHRIIYKTGFVQRNTVEILMDKVESVDVDQSIMGRLLDYGIVTVRGTGAGFEPLKGIAHPIELRSHIMGVASENPSVSNVRSALQSKPGKA